MTELVEIFEFFRVVGLLSSFYIEMSHSVGEVKCRSRNAEHDFVGDD